MTYRNPALLAKITTTLDVISGGRAFLGIGAGWFEDEHDAYGFAFPPLKERFERLEDHLRIARAMFTQEQSSVAGTHHRQRAPTTTRSRCAATSRSSSAAAASARRCGMVAQYADGCNLFGDLERARHCSACSSGHCEDVGRDPAEITKTR